MRYSHDGKDYDGNPDDIVELIEKLRRIENPVQVPDTVFNDKDYVPDMVDVWAPLENVVSDSAKLRTNLANDANYNPYPAVSPSPDNEDKPVIIGNKSELDTGVEYI